MDWHSLANRILCQIMPVHGVRRRVDTVEVVDVAGNAVPEWPGNAVAATLAALAAELAAVPIERIGPRSVLSDDLDLGSLDRVELAARLGIRLGVAVPDNALTGSMTVRQAVDYVTDLVTVPRSAVG
jgi:acyl carrier protein